jgi:diguanylate cyclase (GGDEF)-like protein
VAVLFILCVGILNLTMGFGVAVYAARRYRTLCRPACDPAAPVRSAGDEEPVLDTASLGEDAVDAVEEFLSEVGIKAYEPEPVEPEAPEDSHEPEEPEEQEEAIQEQVPADEEAADSEEAIGPEEDQAPEFTAQTLLESLAGQGTVEEAVVGFRERVEKFHDELTALDEELRDTARNPNAANVEACLESLSRTNHGQLESCEQVQKVFQKFCQEIEEFHVLGDDLLAAVEEESSQIRQANQAIGSFDYQSDLAEGCRQMLSETSQLIHANHHLRDATEEAFVGVMRNEQRLESLDDFARMDPLTGILGRGGLEAALAGSRQAEAEKPRPYCLAMFDLDQFGRINERVGQMAGDRILHLFAQLLKTEAGDQAQVARHSGQRFAVVLPNNDVQTATNVAERIRQTLALVEFHYRDDQFKVTVSCAVVEASSKEASDSLYRRAETALEEAKRYGRNRTFLHEGGYPAPVVPPSFTLSGKIVTL